MACGVCPVEGCGRVMRPTEGGCTCSLHPENGIFPPVGGTVPSGSTGSDKSKQGSGPFSDSEIKQGYRKI
jgi:hypothetical protein